ncbi:MAG: hypothetical protein OXG87_14380 [Gemmatimonadetes bacterium]|nr:hypothetical protein [Gemmatimonadota bacterium]
MRHIKIVQTILFTGIALVTFCTSALADMDWKRMKRDLSIQESILDQFFEEKKVSTTGLYIENHGVLLIASGWMQKYGDDKGVRVQVISANRNKSSENEEDKEIRVRVISANRDKSSENEEEILIEQKPAASKDQNEVIKKQITEFLSIYGNAIGQLKDDNRVTVLLHPAEHSSSVKFIVHADSTHADKIHIKQSTIDRSGDIQFEIKAFMEEAKKQIEEVSKHIKIVTPKRILLEATVTKRDIDAHNRGKIDEQTFRDQITFREHKPQPARDKTIDIMADILTNILKKDTDLRFLSGTQCTGFYQKCIGALFLISQQDNQFWYDGYKRESDRDDELEAFKTSIIETLADYGPTLRDLSPEESIIVHTNLVGQSHFKIGHKDKTTDIKRPDRILFRVAKRDIEAYASQKIDLDTLKKRVAITEM